jgi:RNA polymerase sigma factor (sigma-70 family)
MAGTGRENTRGAGRGDSRDDAALVRRCAAGDEAAWEEFLARVGPLIQAVVRRVLQRYRAAGAADEEDAFAAVIEALLKDRGRALRSFREPWNLPAWIAVVARRQCRAFLESRRVPEVAVESLEAVGGADGPVVDGLAAREDAARREAMARAVRELMAELPPRDRLLVRLFYFDRKKYREIAEVTRMPMANVGKTLARAVEKLRDIAERHGWRDD